MKKLCKKHNHCGFRLAMVSAPAAVPETECWVCSTAAGRKEEEAYIREQAQTGIPYSGMKNDPEQN